MTQQKLKKYTHKKPQVNGICKWNQVNGKVARGKLNKLYATDSLGTKKCTKELRVKLCDFLFGLITSGDAQ